MNELEREIHNQISSEGPLSVADFMNLCLAHPTHGYYTSSDPIGKSGDFITAPEISQMFGELIGVWCMEVWQKLGSPKQFNLVELGPGHGTLMDDLLRAGRAMPAFMDAVNVHLVEISSTLIEQQKQTLSKRKIPIRWMSDVSTLPKAPTILIANEFLDALPFHQWVKHENKWYERVIGSKADQLVFQLRPNTLNLDELPSNHFAKPDGTIFETAPARKSLISNLANHVHENSGAALFIDYGHLQPGFGDTFQAISAHKFTAPLTNMGLVDLTSHVDFSPLVEAALAANCKVPRPVTQGEFLLNLGLLERAGKLGAGQSKELQQEFRIAVERLAKPDKMGTLFKAMAFGSREIDWPGFST